MAHTPHARRTIRTILSLHRTLHLLSISVRRSYASTGALVAAGIQLVHTALRDCFVCTGVGTGDAVGDGVDVAAYGFAGALRGVRIVDGEASERGDVHEPCLGLS